MRVGAAKGEVVEIGAAKGEVVEKREPHSHATVRLSRC